jgi:hypothetical protein
MTHCSRRWGLRVFFKTRPIVESLGRSTILSSITLSPVSDRILVADQNLDPNLVAAHLDRKDRSVVRPQVEGATALEVETGVVPMTSQDAVLDTAPLEWEAHVRAPIVEGENAPVVEDDEYRTVGSVHNEPTLRLQLLKTAMPTATAAWAVRSQYGAGVVLGERVKAYRKEPNVSADSNVETHVAMGSRSTIGPGPACRSMSVPASTWRSERRRSLSASSRRLTRRFRTRPSTLCAA